MVLYSCESVPLLVISCRPGSLNEKKDMAQEVIIAKNDHTPHLAPVVRQTMILLRLEITVLVSTDRKRLVQLEKPLEEVRTQE